MAWSGYIALGTVVSSSFTEMQDSAYARQPWSFSALSSDGHVAGTKNAAFGLVLSGVAWTYNALAFFTAATGGAPVLVYPLQAIHTVPPGTSRTISGAAVSINTRENLTSLGMPLPAAQVAAIAGNNVPSAVTTPSTPVWRPVSTRSSYPGAVAGFTSGKKPSGMTRVAEYMPTRAGVTAIRIGYLNSGGGTNTDGVPSEIDGAPITITASIEYNPSSPTSPWPVSTAASSLVLVQATFNGALSATLVPGGCVWSDPIYVTMAAGQLYYTRTHFVATGSGKAPAYRPLSSALYEVTNDSSFALATVSASATPATTVTGTVTTGAGLPVVLPLVPGSIVVSGGSLTGSVTDNGSGGFPVLNGLAASSTIDYTTGAVTLNFSASTVPNAIRVLGYGNSGVTAPQETLVAPLTTSYNISSTVYITPNAIMGLVSTAGTPLGICAVGDSIIFGNGNSTEIGRSWIDYCAAGAVGFFKFGQSSETAATFAKAQSRRRRMSFAGGNFDRIVEAFATNDMIVGPTLASLQASKLAIWADMAAILPGGISNLFVATVLPRTTSNVSQAPLNAAYASGSSLRNLYNAWLLTQVGVTIGGVIDIAAALETSPGAGTWSNLSFTSDGTHPNYAGYQAIAAMFGPAGTRPHPAFAS